MNAIHDGAAKTNPAGKAAWILLIIAWVCFLIPIPGTSMFLGWPINLVAFILAIVAMAKGGTMKGLLQLLLSLVGSPIVYFIGVSLLGAAVVAAGEQGQAAQKQQAASQAAVAVPVERIEVSARELYEAYKANEITANAKYKGKPLLISGRVLSIQSDFRDKPVVSLDAGDFGSVTLNGVSLEDAGTLSKGSDIVAACTGNGEMLSFPAASDCKLQ